MDISIQGIYKVIKYDWFKRSRLLLETSIELVDIIIISEELVSLFVLQYLYLLFSICMYSSALTWRSCMCIICTDLIITHRKESVQGTASRSFRPVQFTHYNPMITVILPEEMMSKEVFLFFLNKYDSPLCLLNQHSIAIRACISNFITVKKMAVLKASLKLGHGWHITSHF